MGAECRGIALNDSIGRHVEMVRGIRIATMVAEEVGVARSHEVVRTSVALSRGALWKTDGLCCLDSDGELMPMQARSLERWPDGSIRWLGVHFVTDIPAQSRRRFVITNAGDGAEESPTVVATAVETEDKIRLNSGAVKVDLGVGQFDPLSGLAGIVSCQAVVLNSSGDRHTARVTEASLLESGPVAASARVVGNYQRGDGASFLDFEAVVGVVAGSSAVSVDMRIINREPGESAALTAWLVDIAAEPSDAARCGVFDAVHRNRAPFSIRHRGTGHMRGIFMTSEVVSDTQTWEDASPPSYWEKWEWAELHGRQASNWLGLDLSSGREIGVGVFRFAEDHPSELRYTGDGVEIGLWPSGGDPVELVQGMAKTCRIVVEARPAPSPESHLLGMRIDSPLIGWQADAVETSDVPLGVLPYLPDEYPNLEALIRSDLFSWYSAGQSLGFLDHGDGGQHSVRGPRVGYSANNEHDALYALVLHYLRCGERAYFDAAEAYANHLVDIDIIHHSDRNDFETGGVRAHGRNHVHYVQARTADCPVETSVDTGHMWVEGLLWFGAVAGDCRYQDAARGIGDCLLRLVDMGWARPEPGPRNAGWPLIALSALARATGETAYLDGARTVAETAIAAQRNDGRWTMRQGRIDSGSGWQHGLLLTGLTRLYAIDPTPKIDAAITAAAGALLDHGRHRDGTFTNYDRFDYGAAYDTGLVRESLAAAYRHTGEKAYLEAGLIEGNRWRHRKSGTPTRSHDIAEWRGHLPFLACAHEAGLLADLVAI